MTPLVFAHGNSFPGGNYSVLFEHLRQRGFSVAALDCFGHDANFPVTSNWPHLVDQLAAFTTREIGRTGEPVYLVGHALGGIVSGMMAALGQLAIPIPFVGAAIGGMIGYTLSSLFYQSAVDAARGAEASRKDLERIHAIQTAARGHIAEQQAALDAFVRSEIPQLQQATQQFLGFLDSSQIQSIDAFSSTINQYATLLGKNLEFQSMQEFDDFMDSDRPLEL